MSSSEAGAGAAEAAQHLGALGPLVDALLARGEAEGVPDASLQEGLTALVKLYAAKHEAGRRSSPVVPDGSVSATAAMVFVTALLEAVHVELFELGMWQAWAGR